jgi:chloramphenicol 3-O-phosphotransferase
MNLIFLYGPPATGKLTVAQELSRLLAYPVFHNHLTRDLVRSLYPGKVGEHYDLVETLRRDVFEYCTQHDTSLIFTYVYGGPEEDAAIAKMLQPVKENGGTVYFVELTAPHEVILDRVANESRRQHRKIVDREKMASLLEDTMYVSMPYDGILKIDTSVQEPQESAVLIGRNFDLFAGS